MARKKKPREGTKAREAWDIRELKKKCLKLWKQVVKAKAGNRCEISGSRKMVQAHHIEDYMVCYALRYDPRNGVACTPKFHKFGKDSFHRSFIFTYDYMTMRRPDDLLYLQEHRNDKVEFTKEYLLNKIKELESYLKRV